MAQPNDLKGVRGHMNALANQLFDNAGEVKDNIPAPVAQFFRGLQRPTDPNELLDSPRVMLILVLSLVAQNTDLKQQLQQINVKLNQLDNRVTALERRP